MNVRFNKKVAVVLKTTTTNHQTIAPSCCLLFPLMGIFHSQRGNKSFVTYFTATAIIPTAHSDIFYQSFE